MSFQVKIRRKCEDCNGQGIVVHPDWRDFWAEHNPKDHGFYDRLQDLVCEAGLLNIPEEIDCPDCKGTGWVEKWADFAKPRDILDAVGEFIRKRDGEKKQ